MSDAVGIGAFNLLRREAYIEIGGFESLRMEIVEDLGLGRRIKRAGLAQRIAFGRGLVSVHWASGTAGLVNVMTKNLFAVFRFSTPIVLLFCVWLSLFCLGPVAFLAVPETRSAAILTLVSIAVLYVLSSRHSRISPWYAILFPAGAILFIYSLIRSAFTTLKDGGVTWRGTFYPLAELRKSRVPLG